MRDNAGLRNSTSIWADGQRTVHIVTVNSRY